MSAAFEFFSIKPGEKSARVAHPDLRKYGENFESKKLGCKDEKASQPVDLSQYSKEKTSSGNYKKINNPLVRKDGSTGKHTNVRGYAYDMCGHTSGSVDRYLELSGKTRASLKPVSTHCIDDHQLLPEDDHNRGVFSKNSPEMSLRCSHEPHGPAMGSKQSGARGN